MRIDIADPGSRKVVCLDECQHLVVGRDSTAPADATTSLPVSVLGSGVAGVPPGVTSTNVMLYAPVGATVEALSLDGRRSDFFETVHDQRPVAGVTLYLDPGSSARWSTAS